MKLILALTLTFILSVTHAQIPKYRFSIITDGLSLLTNNEKDSLFKSLDGFLKYKNESIFENPYVDTAYARKEINPFEWSFNIEHEGDDANFYKPTVLAVVPVVLHEQYLIKLAYAGVTAEKEIKYRMSYSLIAKRQRDKFYFSTPVDYNTRNWIRKQVGSIKYIYPNQLNMVKAKQMDRFNKSLARKMSVPVLAVTYYRCDDPEQLFRMMGYDYTGSMYLSTSSGLAHQWKNEIMAGNNSEWYPHELVHCYTDKLFAQNYPIVNEGYATYLGGSGGWTLDQAKVFVENYLNEHPKADMIQTFLSYDRMQYGISITYVLSGLICRNIETKYGFAKIKELFKTDSDENYFKILQQITGVTKEQFPAYIKKLVY
ncbi:MAG: hypothetical protein V4560_19280 [Bacteroidota bacterium]